MATEPRYGGNPRMNGHPFLTYYQVLDLLRKSGEGLIPFGIRQSNLNPEFGYLLNNRTQFKCMARWEHLQNAWNNEEARLEAYRNSLNKQTERNEAKRRLHFSNYNMHPAQLRFFGPSVGRLRSEESNLVSYDTETLRVGDWPFPTPEEHFLGKQVTIERPKQMAPKNNKNKAKFYIGASDIAKNFIANTPTDNMFVTVDDAVEEAKKRMLRCNVEEFVIVQIIRVVKRATAPVKVEIVK